MPRHHILLIVSLLAAATTLHAQSYSKEVDVTVELQPELRATSRLDLPPDILTKSFPVSALQYNGASRPADVTPMMTRLDLVNGDPVYRLCDMRGYVAGGYFPGSDINLSAGYRIIDSRSTRLDAWGQFNRNSYKGVCREDVYPDIEERSKQRLSTNDLTVGLHMGHSGGESMLTARAFMYLSRFNYFPGIYKSKNQNTRQYKLDVSWRSATGESESETGWSVEGNIERFGFGKVSFPTGFNTAEIAAPKPLNETSWQLRGCGRLMMTEEFGLGLAADYRGASLNRRYLYMPGADRMHESGGLNRSVVTVNPTLMYDDGSVKFHVGPLFDIGHGIDFSAAGSLGWKLSSYLMVIAEARSGSRLNTLGQLYQTNRYMAPLSAGGKSFLRSDIKCGITAGPVKGISITARGGFSKADNWMSAAVADGISTFITVDQSAWWWGVDVRYDFGNIVTVSGSMEGATGNRFDRAYYLWADKIGRAHV